MRRQRQQRTAPLNMQKMAEAFAMPGTDPRKWITFCRVTGTPVVDGDSVLVRATVVPDGIPVVLRVDPEYSGSGYAMFLPLEKNTTVLAAFPDGRWENGVVIKRLIDSAHQLPQEAQDQPENIWLVANRDISIIAKSEHKIFLKSGNSEATITEEQIFLAHGESEAILEEGKVTLKRKNSKAVMRDAGITLKADVISLETTGDVNTSKVFVDGINFNAMYQTPAGPTVGPPLSNPVNPNAVAIVAYKIGEAAEEAQEAVAP